MAGSWANGNADTVEAERMRMPDTVAGPRPLYREDAESSIHGAAGATRADNGSMDLLSSALRADPRVTEASTGAATPLALHP